MTADPQTAHSASGAQAAATEIPKRCPECAGRYPADFRVCPRDATPLEDAPEDEDPLVGSVLSGTYEILHVIGEGGMGRVYEAAHCRLRSKHFAIKVLHHELARQPDVVSRFQREAEAASALRHPNVVEVFDVNRTPDGRPYLVAELLEGEELGQHLDRVGRLGLSATIEIARQLCRALGAAHAAGVVHRDMKPENVFLVGGIEALGTEPALRGGASFQVKVLDFGISKLENGPSSLTRTGMVMGTPAYMPPEQARGGKVDHRVDIYAVGAIVYRALTGAKPFEDLDPMATLTAVIADEPRRPSTIERSIPPALELVIQQAMAKNPNDRHGSFAELEAALAELDPRTAVPAGPAAEAQSAQNLAAAETVFDDSVLRARQSSDANLAAGARPRLLLLAIGSTLWLLAGLVDAIAGAVRALSGTAGLTRSELVLSSAGALALLIAPGVYGVRYLARRVWPITPRVVETAQRLQRALTASVAAYALVTLGSRVLATFRDAGSAPWSPGMALSTFTLATACAVLAWLVPNGRRRA